MDYFKHYYLLIERARNRTLDCYVERHHIIPKCLGGLDARSNIVALTAEEHYLAHQLLVKMYPKNSKLVYAAIMMSGKFNEHRLNNKSYGWIKRKHSENVSRQMTGNQYAVGHKHTQEWLDAHHNRMLGNQYNTGRKWSDEVIAKRAASNSIAQKGSVRTEQHKAALSEAWADPEKKAYRASTIKAACSSPESRARRKAAWADPDKKAKRVLAMQEAAKDKMLQARKSVTLATTWARKKGVPFSAYPIAP